jgi:glycosyltransferase involved in cell wall biosynthesis
VLIDADIRGRRDEARAHPSRRAFVLLAPTRNVSDWQDRYRKGLIPDWSPYGYGHAQECGYSLIYSQTQRDSLAVRAFDAAVRIVLGFKVVHVARNWKAISDPSVDAIWTHTEREFLPLLFLSLFARRSLPPVIAQSVWLIDEWRRAGLLHRLIARALMRRAALCTFLSPVNAQEAERLDLGDHRRIVAFGVSLDSFPMTEPKPRLVDDKIRIFTLGNDRHRDWSTFAKAFCNDPRFEIFAATSTSSLPSAGSNWHARQCTHAEVIERYQWADVVVVPLTENQHASGITSVLEATLLGRPVVASDTGGLDWYFDRDEIALCPVGDARLLAEAAQTLAWSPERTRQKVHAAQATVARKDLSSRGFALRHVEMTEALLRAKAVSRKASGMARI